MKKTKTEIMQQLLDDLEQMTLKDYLWGYVEWWRDPGAGAWILTIWRVQIIGDRDRIMLGWEKLEHYRERRNGYIQL